MADPIRVGDRVHVTGPLPTKVNAPYIGRDGTVEDVGRWGVGVRIDDAPVIAWFTNDEIDALEVRRG